MADIPLNDKSISNVHKRYQLALKAICLSAILLVLPQLISSLLLTIYAEAADVPNADSWFFSGNTISITMLFSSIITFFIFKQLSDSRGAIAPMKSTKPRHFTLWLSLGVVITLSHSYIRKNLGVADAEFMVQLSGSITNWWLAVPVLCIIVPIVEELIFRGMLMSRLKALGFSNISNIVVVAIVFTTMHMQYAPIDLLFLLSTALFLCFVRSKTDNILLCCSLHIVHNSYVMALFYFVK